MSHKKTFLFSSLIALLLFPLTSFGQYTTLTFTSIDPLDGPSTWGTYCYANGSMNAGACNATPLPAYFNNPGLILFGFGGQAGTYPYAGGTFLTYVNSAGTIGNVGSAEIYFYGSQFADFGGLTIYHEAGSDIDFTITTYDNSSGVIGTSVETVQTARATNVTTAGMTNVFRISITPSSATNFGINSLLLAEPAPFPVNWSGFEINQEQGIVDVAWSTAQETNNDYFLVERATESEEWVAITTVDAAGDSDHEQSYQFIDNFPPTGEVFYRIKQVDIDGTYAYTSTKSIMVDAGISLSPNPTSDQIQIAGITGAWEGEILDLNGRVVQSYTEIEDLIDLGNLANGVYILKLSGEGNKGFTQKIVKF